MQDQHLNARPQRASSFPGRAPLRQLTQTACRITWASLLCSGAAGTALAQSASTWDVNRAEPLVLTEIAFGLEQPWAMAFLPSGDFLVTEREGTMRVVQANGRIGHPIAGVPPVAAQGQGGLLDVVLDRQFAQNRRLFFCFSEPDPSNASRSSTALASARLNERHTRLENVQVIFHQMPRVRSDAHFGCRIAQAQDGSLFLALGERSIAREQAQRTSNHLGSIVRLQPDGKPFADNSLASTKGKGLPETWSWGHRNPQGLTITPDGELWAHEHGPQGGDEFNHIRGGANYGWPLVTYGRAQGAGPRAGQPRKNAALEAPVHYWGRAIAPSGLTYLDSGRYGAQWQGSFFVGSLRHGALVRLKVVDDVVQQESWHRIAEGEQVRDVRQGPDGLLYVLTDRPDGRLLRVEPPKAPEPEPAASAAQPPAVPQPSSGEFGPVQITTTPPVAPQAAP